MIRQSMTDPEAQHHERVLLGTMMYDNSQIPQVVKAMSSAFFRVVKHRFIFEAIQALHRSYTKVDAISVINTLTARKQIGIVGGAEYIAELIGYATRAAQAHHDAAIRAGVKEAGGKVE